MKSVKQYLAHSTVQSMAASALAYLKCMLLGPVPDLQHQNWISTKFQLTLNIWEALLCKCWCWYFWLALTSWSYQGERGIPAGLPFPARLWAPGRDFVLPDTSPWLSWLLGGQWAALLGACVLYRPQPAGRPWMFPLGPYPDVFDSINLFNPQTLLVPLLVSPVRGLKLYTASWGHSSSAGSFYAHLPSWTKQKY